MSCNIITTTEEDASSNFGCNICLELARDPIVTLCGHLFCWPCLYKWLHYHSQSKHCPVCKASVKEDSLVPLYGMGKPSSDPRSKPCCGVSVPDRPSAIRIETARPPLGQRHHGSILFGGHSGFAPMPTGTRFSNFLL
ncbi:PREDICTED: E3 ubiquitin-protein ligase RMA1H1-like [Camelina sativa]|uniref:E3 ubiquitin-protein ligase RMA n=1 Tax=Camelina sativa TaxID=90675 RepID=A0ABM1Q9D7_CAMSA|nr:PREDICTED: E3 ubiquitin-protein ligase RMA1H1-like [Camelina sativa]